MMLDTLKQCDFSDRRWYALRGGKRIGYVSERYDGFHAQRQLGHGVFYVVRNFEREDGLWPSLNQAHRAIVADLEGRT